MRFENFDINASTLLVALGSFVLFSIVSFVLDTRRRRKYRQVQVKLMVARRQVELDRGNMKRLEQQLAMLHRAHLEAQNKLRQLQFQQQAQGGQARPRVVSAAKPELSLVARTSADQQNVARAPLSIALAEEPTQTLDFDRPTSEAPTEIMFKKTA